MSNKRRKQKIIQEISEIYADATHNCSAYITTNGEGFDDKGEPSGTAGKPMLNALRKNDLHNITAIVTRYFGGIKLGAGGLVRAYSKSVLEAIENSEIIEIEIYDVYTIQFKYTDIKLIENGLRTNNVTIINKNYLEKIEYDVVSSENRNIKEIFIKFKDKVKVIYKNKEALKKN